MGSTVIWHCTVRRRTFCLIVQSSYTCHDGHYCVISVHSNGASAISHLSDEEQTNEYGDAVRQDFQHSQEEVLHLSPVDFQVEHVKNFLVEQVENHHVEHVENHPRRSYFLSYYYIIKQLSTDADLKNENPFYMPATWITFWDVLLVIIPQLYMCWDVLFTGDWVSSRSVNTRAVKSELSSSWLEFWSFSTILPKASMEFNYYQILQSSNFIVLHYLHTITFQPPRSKVQSSATLYPAVKLGLVNERNSIYY